MRIHRVQFAVPQPSASAAFYRDVLGLPVTLDGSGASVRIGWTQLVLVADAHADPGTQHLAVTVPPDASSRAHDWLEQRVPLLTHDGATRFETSPSFDAESAYFDPGHWGRRRSHPPRCWG
ncbi:MAG: VOC family protein [Janthinobacterium lividum]